MKHWFTFLRHGESEGNKSEVLQGQIDSPLTETGRTQARLTAEKWRGQKVDFDSIISSPLQRAQQTAEIVADVLGFQGEITLDPIWMERKFGALEGKPFVEINQTEPAIDYFHPYIPAGEGGESQVDLYIRAAQGVQRLLLRPSQRTLVVSHGALIGKVLFFVLGITPQSHYNSPIFYLGNTTSINLAYNGETRQWFFFGLNNPAEWSGMKWFTNG
jgi:2,3-bisphosphoglycerate-dependent phosphoglycerate mutase